MPQAPARAPFVSSAGQRARSFVTLLTIVNALLVGIALASWLKGGPH